MQKGLLYEHLLTIPRDSEVVSMEWAECQDLLLASCESGIVSMLNIEPNSKTMDVEAVAPPDSDDDEPNKEAQVESGNRIERVKLIERDNWIVY